ncbi:MAG: hypothetical protein A2289_00155 [Deltaproteobacteria bacterium RIFOXYA12_FULL_58_15]|nr:MAG: hypothetical protein A2289_00155 [Deltaproteobacteria bacterium RIFOXYA12_FULL_58_15]OGR08906.1 MAG: hypothetical protein A2341_27780 [Deltaproteobacteria bacterium RIFOXYB12_FULL_58_9]
MTDAAEEILFQALELSVDQRAELVARLLESLDGEPDEDVEAAWAAEIQRRVQKVRSGQAQFDDWDAVKERLRP